MDQVASSVSMLISVSASPRSMASLYWRTSALVRWSPSSRKNDCWLRAGRSRWAEARARCSALFTDGTEAPSWLDISVAEKPITSRRMSTARWRGGSLCSATRNASSTLSRCS